jgi:hypothetical protein
MTQTKEVTRQGSLNSDWNDKYHLKMKGYLDLLTLVPTEEGRDDVKTYFISLTFIALLVRFTIVELGFIRVSRILRSG